MTNDEIVSGLLEHSALCLNGCAELIERRKLNSDEAAKFLRQMASEMTSQKAVLQLLEEMKIKRSEMN